MFNESTVQLLIVHRVRKKEATVFSAQLQQNCSPSFVIFGMNHPEDSLYQENTKFIPNVITPLCSDDVIVTSSKCLQRVTTNSVLNAC